MITKERLPLLGRAREMVACPLFAWMLQPSHDARVVSGSGGRKQPLVGPTTHI